MKRVLPKTGTVLQDDKNFCLEIVDWNGQLAVKKSAKENTPQTRVDRLKNDIYGMQFFAELAQDHPQLKLYVPKVYETGDSYYVREYISDGPVVTENMSREEAGNRLDELARLLADIDRIEPYGEIRFVGSADYRDIRRSFTKWAQHPLAAGMINQAQVDKINKLAEVLNPFLRPRIAHGDMSPYKHAYLRSDNKIALIDFENFTPNAARYFDVAWNYTMLYSFAVASDIPKDLLTAFLSHVEQVKHQEEQLLAVLLQRTFAMQYDAFYDAQKGIDYKGRAAELLELVLQKDLSKLMS